MITLQASTDIMSAAKKAVEQIIITNYSLLITN